MAPLTKEDVSRQSPFAWVCLGILGGVIAGLWFLGKHQAAYGTAAALIGCLGLILPPRERMRALPWRIRRLPRQLDAVPVLATLLSSPGYGVNLFYGANPYDEIVHLVSGLLAGAVLGALLAVDGRPRRATRLALLGAGFGMALGTSWEIFEWATGLIGDWTDTWTDIALTTSGIMLGTIYWGRPPQRHPAPLARPIDALGNE
ncbi:hypothetical protein ACFQY5_09450 [Paeniroseomonas aquatica]|uniref:VanZ-like domain-containing protein n=1 Tax=Paeniroseomonas aquatica TaxID=373043 RepID=A0ABT8A106_9PROT|nr:hypothetical protein [Paeniroseomonas aquatica]MDN3563415.1 hypothetical protein [Paeniroseomonas aquatica]